MSAEDEDDAASAVWEWEDDQPGFFPGMMMPGMFGTQAMQYGMHNTEGSQWQQYPKEAQRALDREWAKGPGGRGSVIVRSGGMHFEVDLSTEPFSQIGIDSMAGGRSRRVRRRETMQRVGPLGPSRTLRAGVDPELKGDGVVSQLQVTYLACSISASLDDV